MSSKKVDISFQLPVTFLKEGKHFIAYTPILDLSTSGKSMGEAKMRFEEVVKIFFEELMQKGTLDTVLKDLGWQKIQEQWTPPIISQESIAVNIPVMN